MELEILKAIPSGGTLIVFVGVVILFLRSSSVQTAQFQAQIQNLTDSVLRVSTETTRAITELTSAVRELQLRDYNNSQPPK